MMLQPVLVNLRCHPNLLKDKEKPSSTDSSSKQSHIHLAIDETFQEWHKYCLDPSFTNYEFFNTIFHMQAAQYEFEKKSGSFVNSESHQQYFSSSSLASISPLSEKIFFIYFKKILKFVSFLRC